jgi:putative ABC transport system permease protein
MKLSPTLHTLLSSSRENLRIAWGIVCTHRMRTALATLGILIGLTTVLLMVTIIQGLNRALAGELSLIGSTTLYVNKFPWGDHGPGWNFRNRPDITLEHCAGIERHSRYAVDVAPTVMREVEMSYRDRKVREVLLVGSTEAYQRTSNTVPEVGRFLTDLDLQHRRYVCVLGQEVADKLFESETALGRSVRIGDRPFQVVGLLERQGEIFDFSMDNRVIIPIGTFEKIYGSRRSIDIEVKIADAALLDRARDEITGIMRRERRLGPGEDEDFAVNHQEAIFEVYRKITSGVYAAGIGIASIALLVGGIGIMNIMLVSVTERTREIGVRKALGASRGVILGQFLIEAVMVCAGGGLLGVLLAGGLTVLIDRATPLPAAMPVWVVFVGLAFSSAVGILFGIIPAARAARLDPIEALRYE